MADSSDPIRTAYRHNAGAPAAFLGDIRGTEPSYADTFSAIDGGGTDTAWPSGSGRITSGSIRRAVERTIPVVVIPSSRIRPSRSSAYSGEQYAACG